MAKFRGKTGRVLDQVIKEQPDLADDPALHPPELLNTISHLAGAVLAAAGSALLVTLAALAKDPWKVFSFSVYGVTLVLLYVSSTLYHAVRGPRKLFCQKLDHMAIFLLIAGSYTPFSLVTLRGSWGWALFAGIWALAIVGIVLKALLGERSSKISMVLYLLMGWAAVVAASPLSRALPASALALMLGGGLFYTLGFVVMTVKFIPKSHEVWHFMVLAGSACHFVVMLVYVL